MLDSWYVTIIIVPRNFGFWVPHENCLENICHIRNVYCVNIATAIV